MSTWSSTSHYCDYRTVIQSENISGLLWRLLWIMHCHPTRNCLVSLVIIASFVHVPAVQSKSPAIQIAWYNKFAKYVSDYSADSRFFFQQLLPILQHPCPRASLYNRATHHHRTWGNIKLPKMSEPCNKLQIALGSDSINDFLCDIIRSDWELCHHELK